MASKDDASVGFVDIEEVLNGSSLPGCEATRYQTEQIVHGGWGSVNL